MGHRCTEYRVTIYADAISAFPKCTGMIPLTKAAWTGRKNNNSGLCSNFLHRHMTFRISSVSQNRILAAAPCTYGRAAERQAGEPPRLEADLGRPWEPIPTQSEEGQQEPRPSRHPPGRMCCPSARARAPRGRRASGSREGRRRERQGASRPAAAWTGSWPAPSSGTSSGPGCPRRPSLPRKSDLTPAARTRSSSEALR